jgi:CheY-like chemotaxis protein
MARILVVDDSEDVRLALMTLLEDIGHKVFEAEDGSEVIEMGFQGVRILCCSTLRCQEWTGLRR